MDVYPARSGSEEGFMEAVPLKSYKSDQEKQEMAPSKREKNRQRRIIRASHQLHPSSAITVSVSKMAVRLSRPEINTDTQCFGDL